MDTDTAPAPPAHAEPGPPPPRRRWTWGPAPKLLLEAALIVLSVLLGFAANEWQQRESERALTRTVLANFRREISLNLATLERVQPKHARLAVRLDTAAAAAHGDSTAFQVFRARMEGGLDILPLQEAAWEAAAATGALRLLPYRTSSTLSETYIVQRGFLGQTIARFSDRFHSPANHDPAAQRSMLATEHMLMVELSEQEAYLMEIYRTALRTLPASGDGG